MYVVGEARKIIQLKLTEDETFMDRNYLRYVFLNGTGFSFKMMGC